MKNLYVPAVCRNLFLGLIGLTLACALPTRSLAAPAVTLFEDQFTGGIPGWVAVQPAGGAYVEGTLLWVFDPTVDAFSEQSNLYTDSNVASTSRIAPMLINNTVAPANFTYTARLTEADDDGFGLIWGFEDEDSFYRVSFARQNRFAVGWPFQGVTVDRMENGTNSTLFGPDNTFVSTQSRPFDVTVIVSGGQLSLTIVDDPLGVPVTNNMITALALPTSPSARVGIFSWGMAGVAPAGSPIRSFRIQNPVLSPTPLTGDPAGTVLTNWSFLIPPGGAGTTNVNVNPVWGQSLGTTGDRGTMLECSDWTANNVGPFTTNFPAPSAVAGNANWSNYVYTARFISADNDGFGMLLRYQNETNFYRIAFRNQASTSGIKQGISIQKNVNLTFEQIFASTGFLPPIYAAFDVYASIVTNRLQVVVVTNPTGLSPGAILFGPIDITGATVDNGKIGVFSWAQYQNAGGNATSDAGTEVDFVRVQQLSGESLLVSSPFGPADPPVGLNDLPVGGSITASVPATVITGPGVRQTPTGWTGFGSVPASGSGNSVTFTLSTFSSILWAWQTEYLLTTGANAGGTVSASAGPWIPANSNVTVSATPSAGFIFAGWSGDSIAVGTNNLTFPMIRPVTLVANFAADSDADGLADSWETQFFGGLGQGAAGDPDGDTVSNLDEYRQGTHPNFAEALVASDGLSSQWVNSQRDSALPGQPRVVDFGSGYRGVYDDSNDNRPGTDFAFISPTNYGDNASFQSPRMVVKPQLWTTSWGSNFSASIEITVGDNDGNCLYFRYVDERNWYRATLCGETPAGAGLTNRPLLGLSVQSRVNGNYSNLPINVVSGPLFAGYTDPLDGAGNPSGFKRVRLIVNATNENFEVRVLPYNTLLGIPDFDPANELVTTFTDTSHSTGRIGFGFWGQAGFGAANATNGIPISAGGFADNIVVKSPADGAIVFSENWETVPLTNQFPAGWLNPYAGAADFEGNWHMSAHGTIAQQANDGSATSGTLTAPRGDGDGPILLAPNPMTNSYYLQLGFHPFDNDGIGFVYDFQDTNNFSRVLFRSELTFGAAVPPGVTVSRKSGGVWSDTVAGDPTFTYTPGSPFEVTFANHNGDFRLFARELDNPANVMSFHWTGPHATAGNRFGITTWSFQDAHVLYTRAYSLPFVAPFRITQITLSGGNVILDISKPAGANYHVLRASDVAGPYATNAANQSALQYTEPAPPGGAYYRLQLLP